ncbi:hypothetical protein E1091_05750 [Micromonospora fluostatini]|uniref:Uncharacterized protein n=1 Tax=Micromonospora fluostatini TaxID=1629071 RepID=A0ABY2DJ57_9ACTN|nr:hypothetical protein E1091_05750 [Micromonospora fluostatini]
MTWRVGVGDEAARVVAARAAEWLARENGTGILEQVMQLGFKHAEELREVREEIGRGDLEAAARECADLVITARTSQCGLLGRRHAGRPVPVAAATTQDNIELQEWELTNAVLDIGKIGVAWRAQNPRKRARGEHLCTEDVVDHLDEVVLQACRLIHALGCDIYEVLLAGANKVHARLDEMGVPR